MCISPINTFPMKKCVEQYLPATADLTFGPIPSRRLGMSLGINNIPPKICTYACVYCQLGPKSKKQTEREAFYDPEDIFLAVATRVAALRSQGKAIDYLTFVPDGEPTLDTGLGEAIELLKALRIPIAVITNGSLLTDETVRAALMDADLVSVKVDSVDEAAWRKVNRAHDSLDLTAILQGVRDFAREYRGKLITETMLIRGVNDHPDQLERVAAFLKDIAPEKACVGIPTRPPAEDWVRPATATAIGHAYAIYTAAGLNVVTLTGDEEGDFVATGDLTTDLLAITAVHPMREDAIRTLVTEYGGDWSLVENLLEQRQLLKIDYRGYVFYLRKFSLPVDSY